MTTPPDDRRLYAPHPESWTIRIKPGFEREYCHSKFPGEEHYHLLLGGEIHLDNGENKYCLTCALRDGLITTDRQFWQKGRGYDTSFPQTPAGNPPNSQIAGEP